MRVFRRYLTVIIGMGSLLLAVFVIWHLFYTNDYWDGLLVDHYKAYSQRIGDDLSRVVSDGNEGLSLLAESPVMRNRGLPEDFINDEIVRIQKFYPQLKDVRLLGSDGRILAGSGTDNWKSMDLSSWFDSVLRGESYLSDMQASNTCANLYLTIALPVYNPENTVKGVLAAHVDLNMVKEIIRKKTVSSDFQILLIDQWGTVLEGAEEIRELLPDTFGFDKESSENEIFEFNEVSERKIAFSIPVYFGLRLKEPDQFWILSLIFSKDAFYTESRIRRAPIILFLLVSVTLFFLINFLFSRTLRNRISNIKKAVENLVSEESGDLLRDERDDELTDLLQHLIDSKRHLDKANSENLTAIKTILSINKSLSESNQRFQLAVEGANDSIWDWKILTDELYISQRWNHILGLEERKSFSCLNDWFDYILPEDRERVQQVLQDHLDGETPFFSVEYRVINHHTGMRWIHSRGLAFCNEEGVDSRMAGSHTDITVGRQLQEKLHFNVYHDNLTNLPNRMKLKDRIQESLLRAERDSSFSITLLYLDFDGFKHINDTFGHGTGDDLLISIAERLSHCVRPLDLISRIGGDEFVILLDGIADTDNIGAILDRIMHEMQRPFEIDSHILYLSVSIGISELDREKNYTPDEIIQRADIAMFHAKNEGKSQYVFYESSMESHEKRRWYLENELHKALGTNSMQLYYQPVVSADGNSIYGMEALLRWNHGEYGFISPAEFIPIVEESGFITRITRWILFQVCQQAVKINTLSEPVQLIKIAMNVSYRDFLTAEGLDNAIENALKNTDCKPEWIAVEVTEGILIKDFDVVSRQLERIHEMGVVVELDDFGTGYSSLSYLNKFPLKVLKVDRSFIMTMAESSSSMKLVQTIIHMANDLGMKTIAEGVEDDVQRETLYDMGCDFIQGYLIARPLPAGELPDFLARWFWKEVDYPSRENYLS